MENIESKLVDYRIRKRRREQLQQVKDRVRNFLMPGVKGQISEQLPVTLHAVSESDDEPCVLQCIDAEDENKNGDFVDHSLDEDISTWDVVLKYTLWVVYLVFWITLYIICIELQFGIVFLMLSALVAIYLNTRTGPKEQNEISAYSVFNKNCKSIDGTLKAEQFERAIGIRQS